MAAVLASATGNVMEHHHAVTQLKPGDALSHGHNLTCGFVSEDAGSGMRAGRDLLKVCTADAAGVYPNQYLARANGRHRDGFHADILLPVVNRGLHRPGYDSLFWFSLGFRDGLHL